MSQNGCGIVGVVCLGTDSSNATPPVLFRCVGSQFLMCSGMFMVVVPFWDVWKNLFGFGETSFWEKQDPTEIIISFDIAIFKDISV